VTAQRLPGLTAPRSGADDRNCGACVTLLRCPVVGQSRVVRRPSIAVVTPNRQQLSLPTAGTAARPAPAVHCAFCSTKFMADPGLDILTEGYCTVDGDHWICPTCFEDFRDKFRWLHSIGGDHRLSPNDETHRMPWGSGIQWVSWRSRCLRSGLATGRDRRGGRIGFVGVVIGVTVLPTAG
jgi:hypothetical protein